MPGVSKMFQDLMRDRIEPLEREVRELRGIVAAIKGDLDDEAEEPFELPPFPRTLLALGFSDAPRRKVQRPVNVANEQRRLHGGKGNGKARQGDTERSE